MIWRILLLAALAYGAVVLLAWLFQARLLYLPQVPGRQWDATPADVGLVHENVAIATADGVELSAWFVPAPASRATILFFHGNAGNISHRLGTLAAFHELGLATLIVDYRGYGRSGGQPSERGTRRDARAAWRYLIEERGQDPDRIVIAGRSLGSAVATDLAASLQTGPAAVILEAPFTSVPELAAAAYPFLPARWLSRFRYATAEHVTDIHVPLLVIHGRDDEIVPIEHGRRVFAAGNEPKRFLELDGGHNTMHTGARYRHGIDDFLTGAAGLPNFRIPSP